MKDLNKTSKYLSLILRHKPEEANITLDENGWTDVAILLQRLKISKTELDSVVINNDKKRFAYNEDHSKIRANQGHSVEVDLKMVPVKPPKQLFHGTAERNINSIASTGLEKRDRLHVHLSENIQTATSVGQRYGKPVVLKIEAEQMFNDGFVFYKSENNVWLTDHVPTDYINF